MEGFDHWGGGNINYPPKNVIGGSDTHGGSENTVISPTTVDTFTPGDYSSRFHSDNWAYGGLLKFRLKQQSTNTVFMQYHFFMQTGVDNRSEYKNGFFGQDITTTQFEVCYNDATGNVEFNIPSGESYVASAENSIKLNNWNYIESKVVLDNSSGSVIIRLNGREYLNVSGVKTQATANSNISIAYFYGAQIKVDNVVVYDNSGTSNNNWLGECKIKTLYPLVNGYHQDFMPASNAANAEIVMTSSSLLGNTGMTLGYSGASTTGNWNLSLPFTIKWLDIDYTSVYLNAQSSLTFGAAQASTYDATTQGVYIASSSSSDNLLNTLNNWFYVTNGTTPNQTYTIRYEGINEVAEHPIVWEATFYENTQHLISIQNGDNWRYENPHHLGTNGVYDSETKYLSRIITVPNYGTDITTYQAANLNFQMLNNVILYRNDTIPVGSNISSQYVSSNVANSIDTFTFNQLTPFDTAFAVQIVTDGRKDDVGPFYLSPFIRGNTGTEYVGTSQYLSSLDNFYTEIFDVNPTDGTPWSSNTINHTEFGYKITTS